MLRQGYVIVGNRHPLFPDDIIDSIKRRAEDVIDAIERRYRITLPPVRFEVSAASVTSGTNASHVAKIIFSNGPYPDVRVIFSEQPITSEIIKTRFSGTDLLVLIHEAQGGEPNTVLGPVGPSIPRIAVARTRAARAIEDLIIEIRLSNFFRQTTALGSLVQREGLEGLFREKAKFARVEGLDAWLKVTSSRARYAILASLNTIVDDDVQARADSAYDVWSRFTDSVTLAGVSAVGSLPRRTDFTGPDPTSLTSIPKIGKQLPLGRILTASRKLPAGTYTLAILRKGVSARKSPKYRNSMITLFGARSRVNSFRFFAEETFQVEKRLILKLYRTGHIGLIRVIIKDGEVTVNLKP